jgi:hypothetical protein
VGGRAEQPKRGKHHTGVKKDAGFVFSTNFHTVRSFSPLAFHPVRYAGKYGSASRTLKSWAISTNTSRSASKSVVQPTRRVGGILGLGLLAMAHAH